MADIDVTTLENIFRMITPADLLGAKKLAVGKKLDIPLLKDLLDIIYGTNGAMTADRMSAAFKSLVTKAGSDKSGDLADEFRRCIAFFKSGEPCTAFGEGSFMAVDTDGKTTLPKATFAQIIGSSNKLEDARPKKNMSIIQCKSGFLSPAVRNAERVEMFMNAMPSIVVSRMVPYLDVEFAFHRLIPENKSTPHHMWAPSLLKFLLGGDQSTIKDPTSPTAKMLDLREMQFSSKDGDGKVTDNLFSTSGMEMFTSPQTLINASPDSNAGRYVDVLDPVRPFMTIENFTVNIAPTVGMYSFKKASLVFKVHDRSRLSEISDLVRPQVYQDAGSAPTVWITYGWRHPAETGNPYADFINGNMIVREAYKVMNSQFAFDDVGQVTITLQLFTQGLPELRTTNISDGGDKGVVKQIRDIAQQVQKNRIALGLDVVNGVNKEIRPYMLIDAAERGTTPEFSQKQITDALASLKSSLNSPGAKVDQSAVKELLAALNKLYNKNDKSYLDFAKQLESETTSAVNALFSDAMIGIDPFLPLADKNTKNNTESKTKPHPLTTFVEALNAYSGEAEIKSLASITTKNKKVTGFKKKAVSFGKLVSVFTANAFKSIDGIDEMQLYFYQFNDQAGACASVNIADFPIEMPVFLDQYRDHVERKGSERVTLEEFLRLAIDSQLHDIRAIGYGFRQYYAPYDPANKAPATKTGIRPEAPEIERGPFKMPAIDIYVETVFAAVDGTDNLDQLHQFESQGGSPNQANSSRANQYSRIMRIHVFDKANNPYKLATTLLQADDGLAFAEIESEINKQSNKSAFDLVSTFSPIIKNLRSDAKLDPSKGAITNQQIKEYVSKMVPTIVYGTNASSIISANLASKQDALLATTQMQAQSKGSGKPQTLQSNGSDVGGLPLRVVPASMTMTTFGCPLLTYGQQFFIDFNTGTTIDNMYLVTGLTHTITPGKFETNLTLTFYDAYGKFFSAPTVTEYVKSMQFPETKKK